MTGRFGPITGGLSRRDLRSLLGPPDDFAQRPSPLEDNSPVWKYGSFEFHFDGDGGTRDDDQIWMIFADHFRTLVGGRRIQLVPWRLRGRACRADVEHALAEAGIAFEVRTASYDSTQTLLTTAGGVELAFIERFEAHYPPLGLFAITRRLS